MQFKFESWLSNSLSIYRAEGILMRPKWAVYEDHVHEDFYTAL